VDHRVTNYRWVLLVAWLFYALLGLMATAGVRRGGLGAVFVVWQGLLIAFVLLAGAVAYALHVLWRHPAERSWLGLGWVAASLFLLGLHVAFLPLLLGA
jgi:hypothetical protein